MTVGYGKCHDRRGMFRWTLVVVVVVVVSSSVGGGGRCHSRDCDRNIFGIRLGTG